jgi:hypothetical protein
MLMDVTTKIYCFLSEPCLRNVLCVHEGQDDIHGNATIAIVIRLSSGGFYVLT